MRSFKSKEKDMNPVEPLEEKGWGVADFGSREAEKTCDFEVEKSIFY